MELTAVARALHVAATVLLAGALAFRFLVMPARPQQDGLGLTVDAWLRTIHTVTLVVASVSWFAWLAFVGANMSGKSIAEALHPDVMQPLLTRTTFGTVWMVRLALFSIVPLLTMTPLMASRAAQGLAAGIAGAALLSLAWTGHALGGGPMQLALDAIHIAGAGLWLGALLPMLLVLGRARSAKGPAWQTLAVEATRRFSVLGVIAVGALVFTGLLNSARLIGSLDDLGTTAYGLLLLGKLALFAAMLTLAAINRFNLTPRLNGRTLESTLRLLWRNALIELVLGDAIVCVVGLLGVTPPTAHEHGHEPSGIQHDAHHTSGSR